MKWLDFINYGPRAHRVYIPVRYFGIPKLVIVRTKQNGGL